MIGTTSRTYTLPGLPTAASNAAQSGSKFYVTVDANGNLGYITTPISGASSSITAEPLRTASLAASAEAAPIGTVLGTAAATVEQPAEAAPTYAVASLGTSGDTVSAAPSRAVLAALTPSAVADADFSALSGRVGAIEGRVNTLFDIATAHDRRIGKATEGVAMALAMEHAALGSDSNFGLAGGFGYYQNRTAGTMSFIGRVSEKSYVSAGVGVGFDSGAVGARGGFQIEW